MTLPKSIENLGTILRQSRGNRGIREVALEIDVSTATLSRVENGKLPDLDTFQKICKWLSVDPGEFLGYSKVESDNKKEPSQTSFHLKADKNLKPEQAQSLASMIISAQNMFAS